MALAALSTTSAFIVTGYSFSELMNAHESIYSQPYNQKDVWAGLKKGMTDSETRLGSTLGINVAQGNLAELIIRVKSWMSRREEASALSDATLMDKLKSDLENTSTGVAYTLEAMHGYLAGAGDSLIRKFITPFHQQLCSDKPDDAYKHIGWYLRRVNAYLEMQFSYQLCAVALRLLVLPSKTQALLFQKTMDERFKAQADVAWYTMPAVIRALKYSIYGTYNIWSFWRADLQECPNVYLTRGDDAGLWHHTVRSTGTQWRFVNPRDYTPCSVQDEEYVYLQCKGGSSATSNCNVICEATPKRLNEMWYQKATRILCTDVRETGDETFRPLGFKIMPIDTQTEPLFKLIPVEEKRYWKDHWSKTGRFDVYDPNRITSSFHRFKDYVVW